MTLVTDMVVFNKNGVVSVTSLECLVFCWFGIVRLCVYVCVVCVVCVCCVCGVCCVCMCCGLCVNVAFATPQHLVPHKEDNITVKNFEILCGDWIKQELRCCSGNNY